MNKTIGLCLIVKDEVEDVLRIAKNYGEFFHCIFLTVTNKAQWEKFQVIPQIIGDDKRMIVSYYEWDKNFSNARNFNFAQADTDFIFWMDADDDIQNPEGLKKLIETHGDIDAFYMPYLYAFDESGNCTMQHPRERLIKNQKHLIWKGAVHETLIPKEETMLSKGECVDIAVVHRATFEDHIDSHKRNVEILVEEYNRDQDKTDPRTLSYLASELTALKRYKEAIKFYEKHIELSGWGEDKYLSWNKIAANLVSLFMECGDPKLLHTAISALAEAMLMYPEIPDAYLTMGECYWHLKEWNKAIEWTNNGLQKKVPKNLPYFDPTRYSIRPLPILAYAHLNCNDVDKAYAYMREAYNRAPKNPFVRDNFPFFEKVYNETRVFKNFVNIAKYLEDTDKTGLQKLIGAIPNNLAGDDRFIQLRNRYAPAKIWGEKSVVIYCGLTAEEWAPLSVVGGIGGSEEAVIYLSKELVKLGYEVTVFNACGDLEGDYDGVTYKNYWEFNKNDVYNVIISWRQNIFNAGVFGNRKLVWLHDVPFKNDWTAEAFESVDKVIVLSNYHKTLFPEAPEDKIYVSTNGINVQDFVDIDTKAIHRNKNRIIYGSSYNRGLEHLLDMWPDIIKECPLAELHVFYGWNTWDAMNSDNEDLMKWKAVMLKKMKQPGVHDHGRVGHKKLLEEYAKSSIWAYPTFFKEINCITAIKAQASGCFPVYHNLYALKDTVHFGIGIEKSEEKIMLEDFKESLIMALKNDISKLDRSEISESTRSIFSWEDIAKDWSENLFNENLDICVSGQNESVAGSLEVSPTK